MSLNEDEKNVKTFKRTFWVLTGVTGRSIIGTALLQDTGQYVNTYHNRKHA